MSFDPGFDDRGRTLRNSFGSGFDRAQPWISTLARLALGVVLLYSGFQKMVDLPASVRAVRAYQLLPEAAVPIVGNGLPILEVVLGLLLVLGLMTRTAAVGVSLLLLVFVVGIASAWARGLSIDCGCFGGGGEVAPGKTTYLADIIRDVGLLVLAAWLFLWPRSRLSLDHALGLEPQPL